MRHRRVLRRWRLRLALGAALACWASGPPAAAWDDWDYFAGRFVQQDGRVIDLTFDQKSTSEGQSYGLFFALVAGDRARFEHILRWTSDNLADGQLGDRLPAWLWGKRDDGSWGVKDDNAAADGDVWIAYDLLEAGRLWNVPAYTRIGRKLLAQVRSREVVQAGNAGYLLLPGPVGFALDGGARYRVDPSYVPGFMFRYFAQIDADGPWQDIWNGLKAQLAKAAVSGVAPDLYVVDVQGNVEADQQTDAVGSYDAIRVYLWAAISGAGSASMIKPLSHFADLTRDLGAPPEKVDAATGAVVGATDSSSYSPLGFSGALLPYLKVLGDQATLAQQRRRLERADLLAHLGKPTNYYDQALILFGRGWLDGRFRFDESGRLQAGAQP